MLVSRILRTEFSEVRVIEGVFSAPHVVSNVARVLELSVSICFCKAIVIGNSCWHTWRMLTQPFHLIPFIDSSCERYLLISRV